MDINGFITLIVIAVAAVLILQYLLKVSLGSGLVGWINALALGYVGGLMGPKVFGEWAVAYADIAVIPALLGAVSLLIVIKSCCLRTS